MTGEDIERIREENRRRLWRSIAESEHAGFPSRIRAAVMLREAEHRLNDQKPTRWEDEE